MALVEALLVYRPFGIGGQTGEVPLGRTADRAVVRALRDRLLLQAREEAQRWREVDPGVFSMRLAEADRLARVLATVLPDGDG